MLLTQVGIKWLAQSVKRLWYILWLTSQSWPHP